MANAVPDGAAYLKPLKSNEVDNELRIDTR